ncbi:hypothetical protein [Sporisorium scitamineum]|uniref:Uncharacterized protein n=1 Tax=Sporisorium scitamineum TaxID=49012 RepID=A0A0F7RYP9_9BASI|nr:hypothetical protein [Sporisorium scitamineum]
MTSTIDSGKESSHDSMILAKNADLVVLLTLGRIGRDRFHTQGCKQEL